MGTVTFKPKQITKALLAVLPKRAKDVVERRHGLGADGTVHTLEAIGQTYGITRERVRQIENHAVQTIRKSDVYGEYRDVFNELVTMIDDLGSIVAEEDLLSVVAPDETSRNHIHFLLVIGDPFYREKENDRFTHRWYTKKEIKDSVEKALEKMHGSFADDDLISEEEVISRFQSELVHLDKRYQSEDTARRWLSLSKVIAPNPLGEWGSASSPNVRAKGIRDFAYLAVKRHGSPMHFGEVADSIQKLFNRKAHVATCHNELIKDPRFVLVGRGLYALTEWGYTAGVVKDVLRDILEKNGPLTKQEIIDRVRRERYVKDNTIVVNLQDNAFFKRNTDGTYSLVD